MYNRHIGELAGSFICIITTIHNTIPAIVDPLPPPPDAFSTELFLGNTSLVSLAALSLVEAAAGAGSGAGQLYLVHTPGSLHLLPQTLALSRALVTAGVLFKQQVHNYI